MKARHITSEAPELVGKKSKEWELDTTGKVRNYSAQFQVRYTQLKENSLAVV
jgi:hypothetical protein